VCAEACERAGIGAIELSLADPMWLPRRRPRVLTVAIEEAGERLAAVQAELSTALAQAGWYQPEPRPFLAHVTVGRVRGSARVRPPALGPPHPVAFTGSTVTLYRSWPGSRYEPLRRIALSG
jgi:RNA 2',3'-cyclic 3'-phosphodiesterase